MERVERVELKRKLAENKKVASKYAQIWKGLMIEGIYKSILF